MANAGTVISYPIPPYSNPPIQPQFYQPHRFVISAITRGITTLVTTSEDHDYVIGQLIRFILPSLYGTYQLNEQRGYVISIPSDTQVVVELDSRFMDAFVASPTLPTNQAYTVAQILAIGDIANGQINTNGRNNNLTYIPGSFINISPL